MQARLEDVAFKLRIPQRKPWQGMADNVAASLVLAQQQDKVWLCGYCTSCYCQTTSKGGPGVHTPSEGKQPLVNSPVCRAMLHE